MANSPAHDPPKKLTKPKFSFKHTPNQQRSTFNKKKKKKPETNMSTSLRVCCASILCLVFHSTQALASIQTSNPTAGISFSLSLLLMLKKLQFTLVDPTKKLTKD